jgi:hypothetical protein
MSPAYARYALLCCALLGVGVNRAESREACPEKVVLVVQAVEMSAQTLAKLGLHVDDDPNKKPSHSRLHTPPLLKDLATWSVAMDTAVKLGAARVVAATTLITADGCKGEMEIGGGDGDSTLKWSATPTLLGGDKLRVEYHFRLSRSDSTHSVATPSGVKPAERVREIFSGVEIPFDKPILLGRLGGIETGTAAAKDSAPSATEQKAETPKEQVTVVFLVARRLSSLDAEMAKKETKREKLQDDVERLRSTRLDLLIVECSAKKLTAHLATSQAIDEALLSFLKTGRKKYAVAAVKPENNKLLEGLIRPLQDAKVVTVLSAPSLITLNGRDAWCEVGTELPHPVSANKSVVNEYKRCGIEFHCVPEWMSDRKVRLTTTARRTSLDHGAARKVDHVTAPGLNTVEAKSVDEVEFGELLVFGPLLTSGKQADGSVSADGDLATLIFAIAQPVNPLQAQVPSPAAGRPLDNDQRPVREAAGRTRRRAR